MALRIERAMSARLTEVQVRASDAVILQACWFLPITRPARVVVINSATGAVQGLYRHFASWLSEMGVAVLTYDYRGIGSSAKPELLRNPRLSFADWACLDYAAMLREAAERVPGVPVTVFGHSMGGVIAGLLPRHSPARIVMLGAQTCYWRDWRISSAPGFMLQWMVLMPILTRCFGYFPATKLGYPCNIPRGIAQEWWQGCTLSDFTRDARNRLRTTADGTPWKTLLSTFATPVTAISLSDDPIATHAAVDRLMGHFPSTLVTRLRWSPGDFGLRQIGHFGFARRTCERGMWPALLEVLAK
jgi:predicted alpha/beta hydrolase